MMKILSKVSERRVVAALLLAATVVYVIHSTWSNDNRVSLAIYERSKNITAYSALDGTSLNSSTLGGSYLTLGTLDGTSLISDTLEGKSLTSGTEDGTTYPTTGIQDGATLLTSGTLDSTTKSLTSGTQDGTITPTKGIQDGTTPLTSGTQDSTTTSLTSGTQNGTKKSLTAGKSYNPTTSTIPLKKILYWNSFFDWGDFTFGVGQKPFVDSGCPVNNCYTVERKNKPANIDNFSAVIFHGWGLIPNVKDLKELSAKRRLHQRYVMFLLEAPTINPVPLRFLNFFNCTMTYRLDSDIYIPYGYFVPANSTVTYVDVRKTVGLNWTRLASTKSHKFSENKTDLVAWMVSKCKTPGKREVYAKELAKYIKVDIYGNCGKLKCARKETEACYRMMDRKYKFYLSFENSLCQDYVTEKFFELMKYHVVPVVYGGADYARIAPPGSYIDTRDFKSPKDLAQYLKFLDANPEEYNKYFRWKEWHMVDLSLMTNAMCKLCEMLNDPSQPPKTYADLHQWYNGPGVCHVMLVTTTTL